MLKDVKFKHSYSSGYDEPKEFFTEALIESSSFDLGLGFFSSSGIRSLAYGFALFHSEWRQNACYHKPYIKQGR